jgi:hypothetical protein
MMPEDIMESGKGWQEITEELWEEKKDRVSSIDLYIFSTQYSIKW